MKLAPSEGLYLPCVSKPAGAWGTLGPQGMWAEGTGSSQYTSSPRLE